MNELDGRAFRAAWINGVRAHHPGEAKPGYVASWDEMPQWERQAAAATSGQIKEFFAATDGAAARITWEQKSRFVALCWVGQVFRHFADPKPAYVADWAELPEWQKQTDADIFDEVGRAYLGSLSSTGPTA